MFASNFPVDSLLGSLQTTLSGFSAIASGFVAGERDVQFRANAQRIYRIAAAAPDRRGS